MKQLRIVTNGLGYAVEEYREVGFWKKRMEWIRTFHRFMDCYFEDRFDTLEEAQRRVTALKDEWTVVEETPPSNPK